MPLFLRFWQVRDRHVHQRRRVVQPESVVVVDSGRPPTATVDDAGGGAGGGGDRVSVVCCFLPLFVTTRVVLKHRDTDLKISGQLIFVAF